MKRTIVQKKYLKLFDKNVKNKVLSVLFKFPEKEFSLSDLAKEAGVAKSNIGSFLNELIKVEFIIITKLNSIWRIQANQRNWYFIRSKIVYNLNSVYQSGLVEFLIDKFNNPKSIMLFGSFRNGEDISSSDIDIAIEMDEVKEYKIMSLKELSEFEDILGRRVQLHLFNKDNVNLELFNNIANGIKLFGFLEVKL